MARTGVTCRVLIDGERIWDGCEGDYQGVTIEDGLKVTWGRSTVVDQPSPSTVTFTVTDETNAAAYVSQLRIGAYVEVLADGADPDGDDGEPVEAFTDGGFEFGVNGFAGSGSALERTDVRAAAGTYSAGIEATTGTARWSAILAPAMLEANDGGDPAAWDGLPSTVGGNTWTITLQVWRPQQTAVTVRPVLFAAPWPDAAEVDTSAGVVLPAAATGGWVPVEFDYSPGTANRWVGVQVSATGGLTWATADAEPDWTWETSPIGDLSWADLSTINVDEVSVMAPAAAAQTSRLVFAGRISDLVIGWDDGANYAAAEVTAVDFLAEMANRYIGDEPWAMESAEQRTLRIVTLAAAGTEPITVDFADTVAEWPVSWVDVDRQAAAGLLQEVATSVDSVLWSATHIVTGPYVRVEDPGARLSMFSLEKPGAYIIVQPIDFTDVTPRPYEVSACDVLRDPVEFLIDVADIATRAAVEWQEQTVDEEGQPSPTGRTVSQIDPSAEIEYGSRGVSVSTILADEPYAITVAGRLLQRLDGSYRVEGVTVADADFTNPDAAAAELLIAILGGVERGGLPLILSDLPGWSPVGAEVPVYLEGGEYTFTDGGWSCALTVSRASGFGASASWDELDPDWIWDDWSPALSWDDLRGARGPIVTEEEAA